MQCYVSVFISRFKQLHGLTLDVVVGETPQVGELQIVNLYLNQNQLQARYLWFKTANTSAKILIQDKQHHVQINFETTHIAVNLQFLKFRFLVLIHLAW